MKPIVTEKSMAATAENCYTFNVDRRLTKNQIKKVVEERYKVDVVKVRTMSAKKGKKAIVEIKKGQKIEGFGGESEKK